MRHASLSLVVSIVSSLAVFSEFSAKASAVPVAFGPPDNLEFGQAPLPSSTTWSALWDYTNVGKPSEQLDLKWEAPDLDAGSVTVDSGGALSAINMQGNGQIGITVLNPPNPVFVYKTRTKSNQTNDRTIEIEIGMDDGHGNDGSTDNNVLLLDIDITSPRGWTFTSDPVATPNADLSGFSLESNLLPPSPDHSSTSLPGVVYTFSATAVPEPTCVAVILGASGVLLRRRRV